MSDFNKVQNWKMKVLDQKKNEKSITMNCQMTGKKNEDGSYPTVNIRVMILPDPDGIHDTKCDWEHKDLTGKTIVVDGSFKTDEWKRGNNTMLVMIVFADRIREYVHDEEHPIQTNICNLNMVVLEEKTTNKGNRYFTCSKSSGKNEDGTYKKSMFLNVFASKDYELPKEMVKKSVDVEGTFSISEYKKEDGTKVTNFTIFATEVKEHIWEKKA